MSDLQAIRERHERDEAAERLVPVAYRLAHADRATLLAEVDRLTTRLLMADGATIDNGRVMWDALDTLRAENARLKALCGRAAELRLTHTDWCDSVRNGLDGDCRCGAFALLTELREAAK